MSKSTEDLEEITSAGSQSAKIDVMSPFYLHASDNPGQIYVSDLLHDGNYGEWVNDMSNALFAKNKIGFVDGTIPRPEVDSPNLQHWMRCNAMVKGWLKSAMGKDVRGSVRYASTAREIWVDLEERFGKGSDPRAYEIRRAVTLLRQEKMSVSSYYTKLKGFYRTRCSQFSHCRNASVLVMHITWLRKMNNKNRSRQTANPLLRRRRSKCKEAKMEGTEDLERKTNQGVNIVKKVGHTKDQCYEIIGYPAARCGHCQKSGHTKDQCYEIIGYPAGWRKNLRDKKEKGGQTVNHRTFPKAAQVESEMTSIPGLTQAQLAKLVQFLNVDGESSKQTQRSTTSAVNMAGKIETDKSWVIDSGATDHITNNGELLAEIEKAIGGSPVTIPNGDKIPVKSVGKVKLPNGMKIDHVLNIPDFKCNLISVGRLTNDLNCALIFIADFCVIQDLPSRRLIGVGRLRDGLYYLEPVRNGGVAMSVNKGKDSSVWHRRLGHASNEKIQQIQLSCCEVVCENVLHCDSCLRAKQTRLPFSISGIKSVSCFDLIHCDIWGGYKTASSSGAHYFLTIVDDFSRGVWVYLMKYKSEVSHYLIMFCNMIATQFGKKVKQIRTDNGPEFQSNCMLDYYKEHGIVLQTSCTDTPQQNGIVERKHRHVLETARALRFQANLPIRFWGECVLTATYIINRLPSKVINNKTPFEMLFGKKPEYDHLRVFGCLVYAHDNSKRGDKFSERGKPCVFVGYPNGQKGQMIVIQEKQSLTAGGEYCRPVLNAANNDCEEVMTLPQVKGLGNAADRFIAEEIPETAAGDITAGVTASQETTVTESTAEEPVVSSAVPISGQSRVEVRRSARERTQPKRFDGFDVQLPPSTVPAQPALPSADSSVYPLSHYVSYDRIAHSHKAFLATITSHDEPKHFSQAVKHKHWREAKEKEIQALEENGTWDLVPLPQDKRAIDSKWVYKVKFKPNGEIERYKARLVAKGFTQIEGVDFHETFAPVAKLVTVRCLLAIAAKRRWEVHQLDASRNWYHKFTKALEDVGFRQSKADHSLFLYDKGETFLTALIYVDDVILAGNNGDKIQEIKSYLNDKFDIKDLGPLKYFLGIEVARSPAGIVLSQRKYVLDILEESGMQGCKPSAFPMEHNHKLRADSNGTIIDAAQYRRLVGRLLYLTVTRPDLTFAVNVLSQFVSAPRQEHMDAALRVLRYLKKAPGQGILLSAEGDLFLTAYCDADWGGCLTTRRSCTGYFITLGGSPISWRTKRQQVVSKSSAEAEYRAMAVTVSELLWLRWLLTDLQSPQTEPTPLFCDNQAALHITAKPVYHERTKHVEMDCYFVRERAQSREIAPRKISTGAQLADIFTKALGKDRFESLVFKLGVANLHALT
ncbi:Integrase, catalytic core [Corchorus capsularis]|uniref:Integrase, catalytic core n=1 Tax=Corchorus capsularis TaxID=210143 RepID=A0A1R3HY84_COCAP|nr:Integrase, catalytic core [Corchorus capsularis]